MLKIRGILIVCASAFLIGCASHKPEAYFPPSQASVVRSISSAKDKASEVKNYVSPAGMAIFNQLTNSISQAQDELFKYSGQVDKQTIQLAKAQESANYWHDKQIKGLKELWIWRSIAILSILAVVGYIGLKTSWRFFL